MDVIQVKERLIKTRRYFFHGTPAANLESIREHGLHPRFESDHSGYANRHWEPKAAIRYCTNGYPELALSAATNQSKEWDESAGIWVTVSPEIVILRVNAESLLNRPFGLDHSFGEVAAAVDPILVSRHNLTPDEFVD